MLFIVAFISEILVEARYNPVFIFWLISIFDRDRPKTNNLIGNNNVNSIVPHFRDTFPSAENVLIFVSVVQTVFDCAAVAFPLILISDPVTCSEVVVFGRRHSV